MGVHVRGAPVSFQVGLQSLSFRLLNGDHALLLLTPHSAFGQDRHSLTSH